MLRSLLLTAKRSSAGAPVSTSARCLSQQASSSSSPTTTFTREAKAESRRARESSSTEAKPMSDAQELARRILTSPEFFDQPQLNAKARKEAIDAFKRHPVDTGSTEVQVAVLSERILRLQAHFEQNKRDIHSRRGLMELMQRRRKLLLYMGPRDPAAYVRVIEKYQIREGAGGSRVSDRPESWSPPRRKEDVDFRPSTWLEFKKASNSKDVKRKA